jgi:serine/threonine-protein kinase
MLSAVQLGAARYNPRLLQTIDWGLCLGTRERPQSIEEWRRGRDQWPGVDGAWDAEKSGGFKGKGDGDGKSKGDGKDGGKGTWTRYAIIGSSLVVAIVVANGIKDLMYPDPIVQPTPVPGQPSPSPVVAPEPKPLSRGDERHIAALGMVNGTIGSYLSDPDLLLADLRADARNQVLEKAAAIFVERGTLNTQYDSLRDEIFNHVQLVEELSDDAQPQWAGDGLVYLATRAVVRMQDLRRIVFRLSREKRIALIRAQGDPLISVAVSIRDAERGSPIERSALAENVIKQRIREFGFRVASPSSVAGSAPGGPQSPSFAIESEAKLKRLRATLPASGLTIEKYALTSWTVKCVEHSTGEDIYFDNQLPEAKSWGDEDRALQEIGTLIADAFSRDFFAQHLPRLSRQSQLVLTGVQSSEALDLIARELMGLRSVVDVEPGGAGALNVSWYDQGPGGEQSFDAMVLAPLRRKLGADCFQVTSDVGARQVGIRVSNDCAQNLVARLEALPTSALCEAPAQRLAAIAPSPDMMEKVYRLNPGGVGDLAARGNQVAEAVVRRARAGEI